PAMLHELMDELGVEPERVVMVGDTSHDLQMAANAGVHGLGVAYGAHSPQELQGCGPQAVVDSVAALREWLLPRAGARSEEHTSELQSRENLVCRLLLAKKKRLQEM